MKSGLKRAVGSLLSLAMFIALTAGFTTVSNAQTGAKVYLRVADNVQRQASEMAAIGTDYQKPFGDIVPLTAVNLQAGDSLESVVKRELPNMGIQVTTNTVGGFEYINGVGPVKNTDGKQVTRLGEGDAGAMSGWMFFLNDWSIDSSASAIMPKDGDIIEMLLSTNYGADLDADFMNTDTKLKALKVANGVLDKEFAGNAYNYILYVKEGTTSVNIDKTPANRAFKMLLDNEKSFNKNTDIPVSNGQTISLTVGKDNFSSLPVSEYKFHVVVVKPLAITKIDGKGVITGTAQAETNITVKAGTRTKTVPVSHEGVWAVYFSDLSKCAGITATSAGVFASQVTTTNVKSVAIAQKYLYLTKGKSVSLGATALPYDAWNKNIKWQSGNKKIAKVDGKGKITALRLGKTDITVAGASGRSGKITVCVVDKAVALKKLTLTSSASALNVGQSLQLKVELNPVKATNVQLKFSSRDPKILSVDKAGVIKAIKKGNTVVTVQYGKIQKSLKISVR